MQEESGANKFPLDRLSGLWSSESLLNKHLNERNITTLFFAGVNTDQCVVGQLSSSQLARSLLTCILLIVGNHE